MPTLDEPSGECWRALSPCEGRSLLTTVDTQWWIAGGWAVDLFLGNSTREHKDLDIGVFRRDAATVIGALPHWEFFESKCGTRTRIVAGSTPRPEINSLWCRRENASQWELELMLDQSDDNLWIFRRDAEINRPLAIAIRHNEEGIPYLAPEIQLLYKARATRAKDQDDFDRVLPRLDSNARAWLRSSIVKTDPNHAWLQVL
jgi:hypothetical protein